MQKGLFLWLLLSVLLGVAFAKEWYEGGNIPRLDASNFSQAVQEPHRFKFVKFFTHSCRYCRLLKQVEDQLMEEKNWPFRIYDVDCSIHYDLCLAAVQPTGFPYVGIYNHKGQLEVKYSGYYPLPVMREIFTNISLRQEGFLKQEGIILENSKPSETPKQEEPKSIEPVSEIQPEGVQTEETVEMGTQTLANTKIENQPKEQEWSSISEGIKILMVLFGYWMFDKLVRPYLKHEEEPEFKSKTVEIPLYKSGEKAKGSEEGSLLMSDNL